MAHLSCTLNDQQMNYERQAFRVYPMPEILGLLLFNMAVSHE